MGALGSDIATQTADIALMENVSFSIAVKVIFMFLAFTGEATLWMAVFADMGVSLLVVGNALRLLGRSRSNGS